MSDTKLIEMRVENVKRIELAHFFLDQEVVEITGRNGQGKSTLIDSAVYLLGGNRGLNDERLIHGDEEQGTLTGVLMTEDGPVEIQKVLRRGRAVKMSIRRSDGKELKSSWLTERVPKGMVIDVDQFMAMSSRDQVGVLAEAAGLTEKLDELQAELEEVMESRKREKSTLKLLEGKAANFVPHRNVPDGEFKVGELVELINDANKHQAMIATTEKAMSDNRAQNVAALEKIEKIREWIEENDAKHAVLVQELKDLGPAHDVADLQKTLDNAEDLQKKALENANYKKARIEITEKRKEVDELELKVNELDDEKKEAIAAADLGVDGLSFDEDGVTLNGHPFTQASQAEQQIALSALKMDPKAELKLVLAKGAALWDDDTKAKFVELCKKRGYSAMIETVVTSNKGAIVVEDGTLLEGDEKAAYLEGK